MDWAHIEAKVPLAFTFELRDKGKYGFLLPRRDIQAAVSSFGKFKSNFSSYARKTIPKMVFIVLRIKCIVALKR